MPDKKRTLATSLIIVLYAVAVVVIAVVLYANGAIEEKYIADCLKAAGAGIGFAVGMYIENTFINFTVKTKHTILQALKFVIGIAGVLALQEGLKPLIGTGLIVDMIRYFLVLSWITAIYPLIITKVSGEPSP